jgi:septum formation protein
LKLVLASASSSRAELLRAAGVSFEIQPADIDEEATKAKLFGAGQTPEAVAVELAEQKARTVSCARPHDLVIAADQILWFEGQAISKCTTLKEARDLLVRLRGHKHSLIGGLVLARASDILWRHTSCAELVMRDFTDPFLERYLCQEGASILGSVGCYRLEGKGVQLFDVIDGSYFAILGLDMLPLLRALRVHKAVAA